MRKYLDTLANVLEYVIAAMFIRGGIVVLFFQDNGPEYLPGFFIYLVGEYATIAYGLTFLVTGLLLLYSKWFKKKKTHLWILMGMFLTCMYIGPLAVLTNGFEWKQVQIVVAAFMSAWLWLRWKMKTEYIDPEAFREELNGLRTDVPPFYREEE